MTDDIKLNVTDNERNITELITSNEDVENNTTLNMIDNVELNMVDNATNITELNTVQNVTLNSTNIENLNLTAHDVLKQYAITKELLNKYKQYFFIIQIIIQVIVIAFLLIVIIAAIKNKYHVNIM